MIVRAFPYIGAPYRVVVDEEPWHSILERAQRAGLDPTLDKVIETYRRNQERAAIVHRAAPLPDVRGQVVPRPAVPDRWLGRS